jgi:DnaK suppressor protein
MPFSKSKLEQFKKQLLERRSSLTKRIKDVEAGEDPNAYVDVVDQANAEANKSLEFQMKNHTASVIKEVDLALKRIEEGSFGECVQCGEVISEARMKANPATTLCIDCKAAIESEKGRFPGRS